MREPIQRAVFRTRIRRVHQVMGTWVYTHAELISPYLDVCGGLPALRANSTTNFT